MSVIIPVTTGGDAVIEEHTPNAPCEAMTKGVLPFVVRRSPFAVRNWPRMAVMPVQNGRTAERQNGERRNGRTANSGIPSLSIAHKEITGF